ncbi:12535_t:CDS:2 [Funneliformis mosseae]|uniref:12535_t:CDS:1 n=1 Tax=Funneliformis mosseae TaxID=27381 RepID=A0A9N8V898_FUNMO|nr:12535_t:CDS:2 [Funneliformis mosseae]
MSEFYHPFKRKFSPEDPFFTLGNLEFRFDWLKKHSRLQIEEVFNEELKSLTIANPFTCCLPPWCNKNPIMFYTALDYETHYNTSHRHFCQECDKVFPSERWLNLHLTEFHDIMTLMRKEKGEKIHECYVQSCNRFFWSPKKRRLHLIDYHKYPKTFNFGILVNGIIPYSIRNAEKIRKKKRKNSNRNLESSQLPTSTLKVDSSNFIDTEPGTMDVDSLTKSMSNLRLPRVPKTITFGIRTGYKGRFANSHRVEGFNYNSSQTSQHKELKEKVSDDNTQEAMENIIAILK